MKKEKIKNTIIEKTENLFWSYGFTVDKNVKIYRQIIKRPKGEIKLIVRDFEFDENGKLIKETLKGKQDVIQKFVYDGEGKLTQKKIIEEKTSFSQIEDIKYDFDKNIVSRTIKVSQGKEHIIYFENYIFDKNDRIIHQYEKREDGKLMYEFKFDYYDNNQLKLNHRTYSKHGHHETLFKYNENGDVIFKKINIKEFILKNKNIIKKRYELSKSKTDHFFRYSDIGLLSNVWIIEEEDYNDDHKIIIKRNYKDGKLKITEEIRKFVSNYCETDISIFNDDQQKVERLILSLKSENSRNFEVNSHLTYDYFQNNYYKEVNSFVGNELSEKVIYKIQNH